MSAEVQNAVEQIAKFVREGVDDADILGLLVIAIDRNGNGRYLTAYEDEHRKEVIAEIALMGHAVVTEAVGAGLAAPSLFGQMRETEPNGAETT